MELNMSPNILDCLSHFMIVTITYIMYFSKDSYVIGMHLSVLSCYLSAGLEASSQLMRRFRTLSFNTLTTWRRTVGFILGEEDRRAYSRRGLLPAPMVLKARWPNMFLISTEKPR